MQQTSQMPSSISYLHKHQAFSRLYTFEDKIKKHKLMKYIYWYPAKLYTSASGRPTFWQLRHYNWGITIEALLSRHWKISFTCVLICTLLVHQEFFEFFFSDLCHMLPQYSICAEIKQGISRISKNCCYSRLELHAKFLNVLFLKIHFCLLLSSSTYMILPFYWSFLFCSIFLSLQLFLYYWRRARPDTFSVIFLRRYCIFIYILSWFVWC